MTAVPSRDQRRYRRLLWAYPGPYRRLHGDEIVTTLLELTESAGGRPTAAQRLHLLACGVRQRFRLPAGRPLAAVAAVLAALVLGALGAAGGTWLGWQTAAPVPSSDEMRTLTAATAGDPPEVNVFPWETAMKGPVVGSTTNGRAPYSAERIRTALISAGWRMTTFTETTGRTMDFTGDPKAQAPTRSVYFTAKKGGLSLIGSSISVVGEETMQQMDVWAVHTAAVRPLTIAGLLVGALAGWLLTAALAYRVRHGGPAHRAVVAVLGATALAAGALPALDLYRDLYQFLSYDSRGDPYIVYGPGDQPATSLVAACAGIGVVAVVAAVLVAVRGARVGSDPAGREPVASS